MLKIHNVGKYKVIFANDKDPDNTSDRILGVSHNKLMKQLCNARLLVILHEAVNLKDSNPDTLYAIFDISMQPEIILDYKQTTLEQFIDYIYFRRMDPYNDKREESISDGPGPSTYMTVNDVNHLDVTPDQAQEYFDLLFSDSYLENISSSVLSMRVKYEMLENELIRLTNTDDLVLSQDDIIAEYKRASDDVMFDLYIVNPNQNLTIDQHNDYAKRLITTCIDDKHKASVKLNYCHSIFLAANEYAMIVRDDSLWHPHNVRLMSGYVYLKPRVGRLCMIRNWYKTKLSRISHLQTIAATINERTI